MNEKRKVTRDELYHESKEMWDTESYCQVTREIEYILEKSLDDSEAPHGWDDVENRFYYSIQLSDDSYEEPYTEEEKAELLEELQEELEDLEDVTEPTSKQAERIDQLEDDICTLENAESEPWDINEWFIVSGWLAGKLSEMGNPVLSNYIWGRVGCGQSTYMDSDIQQICIKSRNLEVIN